MQHRILVVGLAEATLDLIEPWAEAGRLPTLQRLMAEGTWGRLASQVPLVTPQMWGTIVTGRTPGHHGAFDFWQRGPDGRFQAIDGSALRTPPIWRILNEAGLPCGIVNVPFTYPPAAVDGFMISGEDAPGAHPSIATPAGLYEEMTARFGRYRLKDIFPGGRQKADYLTLIEEDVDKQTDVFEHLFAEKPWRFGIVFFSATAIAQHYFWADMAAADLADPYRNVVETAYRAVDRAVARLCRAVGRDTTIFVISECGAGPLRSGVQINTLLERHGFLRYCRQAGLGGSRRLVAAGRKQAQGLLQRWLPDAMYYRLNHGLRATKARVQSFLADSDIDWAKTTAFSRGKEGEVFVNLHGRDPRGVVAPGAEYEAVRDRLIECFASLRDPNTGENAVEHVYRREALYQGPMLEWAPDLVVAWKDAAYMPTENDKNKNEIFVTRWREYMNWPTSGSHRVDGVLIANGPGIRRGAVVEGARIIDLAPTWLRCLDQPITGKLEGRVIEGLFEPDTAPVTKSVAA